MTRAVVERTTKYRTKTHRYSGSARRVALIGGTTTFDDCLAALYYLVNPRQLVDGTALSEFEHSFSQYIGGRYAYSFCHGRGGHYGLLPAPTIWFRSHGLLPVPTPLR